jgi:hypothetical protein
MAELIDMPIVQADHESTPMPLPAGLVSHDSLQGLEILVDLFSQTCEMVNRGVLSVEAALNALPIAEEAWVTIPGEPSADGAVEAVEVQATSEEHIFNGIAVMIMKMGEPLLPGALARRATKDDQLGYGRFGDRWAILFRGAQCEDAMPLVDAPLEARLRGVRVVGSLLAELETRVPADGQADASVRDIPDASCGVSS